MPMKEYFKVPIPKDCRIYEKEFEIAGISFRKDNLYKIIKKSGRVTFELVAEPNNSNDANAIQIRASRKGFFGRVDKLLGYVPASTASYITDTNMLEHLAVRPKRLFISDNGFVEFIFDILGPKEHYEKYKSV